MNLKELRNQLREQPFKPFLITTSDGGSYPVKHPDMVLVTTESVHIGIGVGRGYEDDEDLVGDPIPAKTAKVSPLHITRLDPMDEASYQA